MCSEKRRIGDRQVRIDPPVHIHIQYLEGVRQRRQLRGWSKQRTAKRSQQSEWKRKQSKRLRENVKFDDVAEDKPASACNLEIAVDIADFLPGGKCGAYNSIFNPSNDPRVVNSKLCSNSPVSLRAASSAKSMVSNQALKINESAIVAITFFFCFLIRRSAGRQRLKFSRKYSELTKSGSINKESSVDYRP